ncbi:MAG: SRPBCC domain-containing protein [Alphaproteobacteria bacterium]|nr:SRPBCC domain-containing protein [Alphaproteobacteria bacterium]
MKQNTIPMLVLATLTFVNVPFVCADDSRVVQNFEIDADINEVWKAFTTKEGTKLWWAPLVEMDDFAVGAKIRSNYNSKGRIGDATTIENTILSFDPHRMISTGQPSFLLAFPLLRPQKNNGQYSTSRKFPQNVRESHSWGWVTRMINNPVNCVGFLLPATNYQSPS